MSKWFVIYTEGNQLVTIGCDTYSLALFKLDKCRKNYNKNCRLFYGTKSEARRTYEIS